MKIFTYYFLNTSCLLDCHSLIVLIFVSQPLIYSFIYLISSYWYNFDANNWSAVYKHTYGKDFKFKAGYDSEVRLGWASLWVSGVICLTLLISDYKLFKFLFTSWC